MGGKSPVAAFSSHLSASLICIASLIGPPRDSDLHTPFGVPTLFMQHSAYTVLSFQGQAPGTNECLSHGTPWTDSGTNVRPSNH